MDPASPADDLERLADTLWEERQVVEYLLFKLVTAKLVLAADEQRFVPTALEEVERMLEALRAAEVRRAAALEAVARTWHVPSEDLTLRDLAERAPEPMATVFRDHHDAFQGLAVEIEATANENRRLATASLAHVRATLDALMGPVSTRTYTATGEHARQPAARPARLDEVL